VTQSVKNLRLDSTALRYFQAAANLKSIWRAAEAVHVSASSLSRQIAALEDTLQVSLFERLPRGLRLTTAGEILLQHVDASFRELQRAFESIDELKNVRRGHIDVAVVESAARGVLPPALSAFWKKHPKVEVSLQVVGALEVVRLLERGEADLGLAFNVPEDTGLPVVSSVALPLGAVVSPSHPLASRQSLRPQDLVGFPLILSDASLSLHAAIAAARHRLPLQVRAVTNSITVMALLAAGENGIALKTITGVTDEVKRGELAFIPITDRGLAQRLAVLTRRAVPLPALVGALGAEFSAVLADTARLATSAGRMPDRDHSAVRRLRSAERA
jgi:DNA-binding transcriptional LysR family regulator